MERRTKIMVWSLVTSLLLASGVAFSQRTTDLAGLAPQAAGGTQSDEARAKLQDALTQISTELNLTDEQKEKIKPILQSEFSQLKTVRDDTSMSPDQKKAKAKEIHDSASTQISSILTPEQQQKWQSMKERAREEREQP